MYETVWQEENRNENLLLWQLYAGIDGEGRKRYSRFGNQGSGIGCAKCTALEESVRAALMEPGMNPAIDHVTDFAQIAACGVMTAPALAADGKVVSCGKVLKKG